MTIGMRHIFSWLHISDLHFGHGDTSYRWNQEKVLNQILIDVERAIKDWPELPKPNAIMVTGDVAFSGGAKSHDEYSKATLFLNSLTGILGLKKDKIYIVPGNHDVHRDTARSELAETRGTKDLDQILKGRNGTDLLRLENFKSFSEQFSVRDAQVWRENIDIPDFGGIQILGLNTALLCLDDNDRGNLELSGEQSNALSEDKGEVRIVLTHHPINEGWLKNESELQSAMSKGCTIHLCGHVHTPQVVLAAHAGSNIHVRIVAAAAHQDPKDAKSEKVSHGYNFSSLMIDANGNLQVRVWPRRWSPKSDAFLVDHLCVPDRRFYDEKPLGKSYRGSGLTLEHPKDVGLVGVHWWGNHIAWEKLLAGKKRLDIFGVSVQNLFEEPVSGQLSAFINGGGEVRAVIADPRKRHVMAQYEDDFNDRAGGRTEKVVAALKAIKKLKDGLSNPERFKAYITTRYFKYSAYRIDGDVLFVPYRMVAGRRPADMPALAFEGRRSVATRFLDDDLDSLLKIATPLDAALLQEILETASK